MPRKSEESEIKRAYSHVLYEIRMLLDLFEEKERGMDSELRRVAFLEALLVHLRILDEFFSLKISDCKYIVSEHFGYPQKHVFQDQITLRKLNQDLAHLSFDRLSREERDEKEWVFKQVMPPVLRECRDFLEFIKKTAETNNEMAAYDRRPGDDTPALINRIDDLLERFSKAAENRDYLIGSEATPGPSGPFKEIRLDDQENKLLPPHVE